MARHNDTGKLGEAFAFQWAIENDYLIKERNWRWGKWEIDLIASKNERLHFFEVKTRRNDRFGHPEDLVDKHKLRHLISAGTVYISYNKSFKWIQFNILAISLDENDQPTYFLIGDVYF